MLVGALTLFGPQYANGADLFRLWIDAPSSVEVGESFQVTVKLDNTDYPSGTGSGIDYDVLAYTFGIEYSSGLEFVSYTYAGTTTEQVLGGGSPLFAQTLSIPQAGTVTNATVLSAELDAVPQGMGNSILVLTFQVPSGTPTGSQELLIRAGLGDPEVPVHLVTADGALVPSVRDADVFVRQAPGQSAQGGQNGPVATGSGFSIGVPAPTAEDYNWSWVGGGVQFETQPIATGSLGQALTLGPPVSPCDDSSVQLVVQPPSNSILVSTTSAFPTIESALAAYPGGGGEFGIEVDDGVYPSVMIDVSNVGGSGNQLSGRLALYSRNGPEAVLIDAQGGLFGIQVVGTTTAAGSTVQIGLSVGDSGGEPDLSNTSPFDPIVSGAAFARGWRGFQVTGARSPDALTTAAGVSVDTNARVELRGNWIYDNPGPGFADSEVWRTSGVFAASDGADEFSFGMVNNDVSDNRSMRDAPGVRIERDPPLSPSPPHSVNIFRNWIHGNEITDLGGAGGATPWFTGRGGGLYAEGANLNLCTNWMYENLSVAGCGAYYDFGFSALSVAATIENNEFYGNGTAAAPAPLYRGGGLAVVGDIMPSVGETHELAVIGNRFYENVIEIPAGVVLPGGLGAVGGGVFISKRGLLPTSPTSAVGLRFTGNAVFDNVAFNRGGGVYFSVEAFPPVEFEFAQNTIWRNELTRTTGAWGSGLYFGQRASLGYPPITGPVVTDGECNSVVVGRGNLVQGNLPDIGSLGVVGWFNARTDLGGPQFVDADQQFHDAVLEGVANLTIVDDFDATSPLQVTYLPEPLLGNPAVTNNTPVPADVELVAGSESWGPVQTSLSFSSLEESIEATLAGIGVSTHPVMDLEGGLRLVGQAVDIGSDEWNGFVRGDVNDDGSWNIADPITLLSSLFVQGFPLVNCDLARDINDDGAVNIADAIAGLAELFGGGGGLPDPFGSCGVDPTPSPGLQACDSDRCAQ